MITITNASRYSTKGAIAHQVDYSDGTSVRAVEGDGMIRAEYLSNGAWKQSGKAYVVTSDKRRNAERIIKTVSKFLN
jgi:hypothetical protein